MIPHVLLGLILSGALQAQDSSVIERVLDTVIFDYAYDGNNDDLVRLIRVPETPEIVRIRTRYFSSDPSAGSTHTYFMLDFSGARDLEEGQREIFNFDPGIPSIKPGVVTTEEDYEVARDGDMSGGRGLPGYTFYFTPFSVLFEENLGGNDGGSVEVVEVEEEEVGAVEAEKEEEGIRWTGWVDQVMPIEGSGQRGGLFLRFNLAGTLKREIEFDVPFKNNTERASLKHSFPWGAGLGFKWKNYRIEANLTREAPRVGDIRYIKYDGRTTDLYDVNSRFSIDGSISLYHYEGSAWYEIGNNPRWVPYVGGGAGRSEINLDYTITLEDVFEANSRDSSYSYDVADSWHIGSGILFRVGHVELDVGHRLRRIDRTSYGVNQDLHLEAFYQNEIRFALNAFFGRTRN